MQLTRFTDYALRTLIQLACSDRRLAIDDVQRCFGMSRSHLTKVVHRLGQLGFITTTRGQNGGMELADQPENINVGDVVRAFEGDMHLLECFNKETNTCPLAGACILQGALGRARSAFMAELDALTIADISANRRALIARLSAAQST